MSGARVKNEGILAGIDRNTGEVKTIDQVVSGKACNCLCPDPECQIPLIAKKGQFMTHHFAHAYLPDDIRSCQETALHIAAKTVAAHLIDEIHLPLRQLDYTSTERTITRAGNHELVDDLVTVQSSDVKRLSGTIEPIVPEISPFRPDAKVQTISGDIFIEIHVTNPVPPEKKEAMEKEDLTVLELDFSQVPRSTISLDELRSLVTKKAPRHWLSTGLRRFIPSAREKLDAKIREKEHSEMSLLFERLRKDDMSTYRGNLVINAVRHMFSGRGVFLTGHVPLQYLRKVKGFWLADLPGAPGTLLTTIWGEWSLNRLFCWHRINRETPLNLLSITADGTTLYSSSHEVVNVIAEQLATNAVRLREVIRKVHLVDRANTVHALPRPLTPQMIEAMGNRAAVVEDLPESSIYDLIMNDFAELVINVTGDNVVPYSGSQLIKRLEGKRPSGGMREQLMDRVRMDSPCRVRFVPSLPAPLDGNVFDLLKLYRGELYLDVMGLDAVRVYFNRADFWGKGGVLVTPEPLSRDDVRLEPSNAFLQDVRQLNEAKTNQ